MKRPLLQVDGFDHKIQNVIFIKNDTGGIGENKYQNLSLMFSHFSTSHSEGFLQKESDLIFLFREE